ncbi:MAG: SpoIIIAH-like family protein [Anaerolineae bacterium]|nr:SpoIIIAH-like family protein [Bacillota bacterium]MDI7276586.1 SpoIIIAH-like family protein [Anaerolineae bacterium]
MKDRARSGFALMVVVAVVLGVLIGTRNVQTPPKGGTLSTALQDGPAAALQGHAQPATSRPMGAAQTATATGVGAETKTGAGIVTETGTRTGTGTGTAAGTGAGTGTRAATGATDGALADGQSTADLAASGEEFFSEYRLERSRARSRNIEILQQVMADDKASEEARTTAGMQLVDLSKKTEAEAEAEALIRARGYKDALVFVRGDTCDVVVSGPELTRSDAEQIGDIVARCLGLDLANITIIERGS